MSDEDLRRLREEKLAEIQKQQAMNEYQQQKQNDLETQKKKHNENHPNTRSSIKIDKYSNGKTTICSKY